MTLDEFFAGHERSRKIFDGLRASIDALGAAEIRADGVRTAHQLVSR